MDEIKDHLAIVAVGPIHAEWLRWIADNLGCELASLAHDNHASAAELQGNALCPARCGYGLAIATFYGRVSEFEQCHAIRRTQKRLTRERQHTIDPFRIIPAHQDRVAAEPVFVAAKKQTTTRFVRGIIGYARNSFRHRIVSPVLPRPSQRVRDR